MIPYSNHIIQNETGLLATDKESWLLCLESLYSDASRRAKLKFNATFAVKSMFDLKNVAREWAEVYKDTINETNLKVIQK